MSETIDIVIPVYKPDQSFQKLLGKLMEQTVKPNHIFLMQTLENDNDRVMKSQDEAITVHPVKKSEFDHGATRLAGEQMSQADYVLFMTQDAMPKNKHLLEELLVPFASEKTAIAYGRQLARPEADIVEQLTRKHNYPEEDRMQTLGDLERLGIKTYFCSDVCAMYKRSVYEELGGFVHPTIFNEDMIMASKVIGAGYQVAYCANAQVIHSHSYTCMQQFHRNFDLGVSQKQYSEVFENISSEKEGAGFAKSILTYLLKHGKPGKAFYFAMQCGFKLFGYKFGLHYNKLPQKMVLACTMSPSYWDQIW